MHLRRMAGERAAWLAWGLAAAFYVVALFHRMSLGVASLDATARFDLAPGTIATLSALQLGLYLGMTIPAGLATDRIGPRRALALGLAAMAVGEITFGLATAAPLALGGRALVGAGDAFIFLSVLRIAQNWFPASRYALLACLTGLAGAVGQLGTTIPLGLSLDGIGWTATFVGSGLLTAGLAVACIALLRDRPAGAPAPAPRSARAGIGRTLRACWARPATRRTYWLHFGLMGPFVAITALWGYPYLVGVAGGRARRRPRVADAERDHVRPERPGHGPDRLAHLPGGGGRDADGPGPGADRPVGADPAVALRRAAARPDPDHAGHDRRVRGRLDAVVRLRPRRATRPARAARRPAWPTPAGSRRRSSPSWPWAAR